ncbi:hypothetical protein PV376_00245 [Streptomyces sp. NRRL_ISP-5395]|uniref:hypothetical protein n=1 Tax=Streptomyces TaxID=1883 RepID=UPI001876AC77|nr:MULTISPECIES: hypothetical protein [Streptomyces]MDX2667931.1 hypothetical protein [Streptomyces sp. NRRL_ISP-5395]GHF64163.1 hypothetical protein GCM10010504_35350 [Streptomyces griseus]
MRCKEMLAFFAGIAVLLIVSAFAFGALAPTPGAVDTAAHSPAVSVIDASGQNTPLEGLDGDVTLQHRHKAGNTTVSPTVQAAVPLTSPDLHDCAAGVARQHASHSESRGPDRARILRC